MKKSISEIVQMTDLLLRKCPWLYYNILSFGWAALAFWAYRDFLSGSMAEEFICMYMPNRGSLLYIMIFYLSYGLPMMAMLTYLKHPLCEEYYYTRIENRFTIVIAKILALTVINGAILFVELSTLHLCIFAFPTSVRCVYDFKAMASVVGALLLPRLTIALLFQLCSVLKGNLILTFTILTGMIFSGVLVNTDIFKAMVLQWFDVSAMANGLAVVEAIFAVVLICAILYIDQKHDISMQEDVEKNDE